MPDPKRNEAALERLARFLKNPRSLWNIMDKFDVSERCAYRWLNYLKQDGIRVVAEREGKKTYYLTIPAKSVKG